MAAVIFLIEQESFGGPTRHDCTASPGNRGEEDEINRSEPICRFALNHPQIKAVKVPEGNTMPKHKKKTLKDLFVLCQVEEEEVKVDGRESGKKMKMQEASERRCASGRRRQLTRCWQVWLLGPLLLQTVPRHRGESKVIYPLVWIIHHLPRCERPIREPSCWTQMPNIWGHAEMKSNFP